MPRIEKFKDLYVHSKYKDLFNSLVFAVVTYLQRLPRIVKLKIPIVKVGMPHDF